MRKKLSILILLLILCAFIAIAGTITIAGSGATSTATIEQRKGLELQKKLIFDAIAKGDQKTAGENLKKMVTEFERTPELAQVVYETALEF
jgi:hypothetical protein